LSPWTSLGENEWTTFGENGWTSLGENGWTSMGENTWAIIARKMTILDPLHYLPLLEQRPGSFEHAKPIRRWRKEWPPTYERLLEQLQAPGENGRGIREFIRILELHQEHPANLVAQAVEQALEYGCIHADGVTLCLRHLLDPEGSMPSLIWAEPPPWAAVGEQGPDLACYDRLLERI